MKTRIVTGVLYGGLLVILLLLPPLVAYCAFALISALAVWEMFQVLGLQKERVLTIASLLFAAVTPFFGWFESPLLVGVTLAVYLLTLILNQLYRHASLSVKDSGVAMFMTLLLSLSISCVVYCRTVNEYGLFYLFLTLFIAWMSDTGAYFAGSFFGKHKLCPAISPKKTVEGFIGGLVFCVLTTLGFAWACDLWILPQTVSPLYVQIALLSLLLCPLSVVGDLFASVVKRQAGAKDYGNIMPGHGGVMDRFDSLLFVAPFVYAVLQITPLLQGVVV